ncbi:galactokinase [Psychromicrobium xiongbiense]|uniref:galactokinase n=1 Tax=Psychromicrobium xiongbiense TaxID=3051184 RepID=UPI0025571A48|nr:galactokinase [Psychromicrobium sp. YIM S02556]
MNQSISTVDTAALTTLFAQRFGTEPDGLWQAPGRVNLIGEHTDYNEGFVLPFAIDRSARVAIRQRADQTARLLSTLGGSIASYDLGALHAASTEGWAKYPLGVAWAFQQAGVSLPGFDLLLDSDVPPGAGLSSSHAIECAVATAFNELSGAGFTVQELVLLTQRAENGFVGAPTGIMDQSASLRGAEGRAVFLDCRSQDAELVPLDLPGAGLALLVVDTKVSHSHADGGYRARREACERGAAVLGVSALRDLAPTDLNRAETLLDEVTFRRVRHVVTEDARVLQTVDQLRALGPGAIGDLLTASHVSMRDDFEISCPELDTAVEAALVAGALGSRMTGGGFGGSAIALVQATEVERVSQAVLEAFAVAGFVTPELFTVVPGPGAQRIS